MLPSRLRPLSRRWSSQPPRKLEITAVNDGAPSATSISLSPRSIARATTTSGGVASASGRTSGSEDRLIATMSDATKERESARHVTLSSDCYTPPLARTAESRTPPSSSSTTSIASVSASLRRLPAVWISTGSNRSSRVARLCAPIAIVVGRSTEGTTGEAVQRARSSGGHAPGNGRPSGLGWRITAASTAPRTTCVSSSSTTSAEISWRRSLSWSFVRPAWSDLRTRSQSATWSARTATAGAPRSAQAGSASRGRSRAT